MFNPQFDWQPLRFTNSLPADGSVILLDCTHLPLLVVLSYVVASGAALDLAERITHAKTPFARFQWQALGGFCLGGGIWSMHFVAMLAFQAPVELRYEPWLTAFSLVIVVLMAP